MQFFRILILIILFSTAACKSVTTVRHSSDYGHVLNSSAEMLALPANAEVNTQDIGRNRQRMYDYEYFIQPIITEALTAALKEKNYSVRPIHGAEIKQNDLYKDVDALRRKYKPALDKMYAIKLEDTKTAYHLDKNVETSAVAIRSKIGKDIVILADYAEVVKSNGARAKDFVVDALVGAGTSGNAEDALLTVGFINAQDGKILWTNQAMSGETTLGSGIANLRHTDEEIARRKITKLVKVVLYSLPKREDLLADMEKKKQK